MSGSLSYSAIEVKELATSPTTPGSGDQLLFPKTDGKWYTRTSAGVEQSLAFETHTHTKSQITDFAHTHPVGEVTGLGGAATLNVGTSAGTVAAGDAGVPTGGTTGQYLRKSSSTNYDDQWTTIPADDVGSTASLRTLGTGAQQAAAGNDARLSDARTPTAHTHTKSQITDFAHTHPNTEITGLGTASTRNVPASGNASATEVVLGSDTRLGAGGGGSGDMVLATAQVVTGAKTFRPGTLVVSNADGTQTAEPYSDLNAPFTMERSYQATEPTSPTVGEAVEWTPDGKSLLMKAADGTTTRIGPAGTTAPTYTNPTTRPNRFDPDTGSYNTKGPNTRRLLTGMGIAASGQYPIRHLFIGDSKTSGFWSGATNNSNAWPRVFGQNAGVPICGDMVTPAATIGASNPDPRWAFGAGFGAVGVAYWYTTTAGASTTYTSTDPGTVVEIVYQNQSTGFQYSIDGQAAVTITPPGGAGYGVTTITGLRNETHRVTITRSGGQFALVSVSVRQAYGLQISNFGLPGAQVSSFHSGGVAQENLLAAFGSVQNTPRVVWISLGTNEGLNNIPVATYKTNLGNLVDYAKAQNGSPEVIIVVPTTAMATATWEPYVSAMYDVADLKDVPLLDLTYLSGTQAQNSGPFLDLLSGLDSVHENSNGTNFIAHSAAAAFGADHNRLDEHTDGLVGEYTFNQPPNPATGLRMFTRHRARRIPAFVGPTGQDSRIQPALFSNNATVVRAQANSTALSALGSVPVVAQFSTGATAATAVSAIGVTSANFYSSLVRARINTSTAAQTVGRIGIPADRFVSTTANMGGFHFVARFGLQTTASGTRGFVGMTTNPTAYALTANPSTLLNQIGFYWDAAQTTLRFIASGSAVGVSTDLGAFFPVTTSPATYFYEVAIFVPSGAGQIGYWHATRVNDSQHAYGQIGTQGVTNLTTFPGTGTALGGVCAIGNGALAATHSMDVQSMYIESDN